MSAAETGDPGSAGEADRPDARDAVEAVGAVAGSGSSVPRVGVVVLTQGRRPDDLARAVASVLAQTGVALDVVVVGNAWDPASAVPALPAAVRTLALPENLGIPAGRNAGARALAAPAPTNGSEKDAPSAGGPNEYLFFLDDDASIPSASFLVDGIAKLVDDPSLGLIQPRVVDPSGAANPRRWVPRMRKGDPAASGAVFSCWEGAVLMPQRVFDGVGGWADPFFYAHEGIELAWRVWDLGLRAWYAGDLVANHPAIEPTRHAYYYRLNARNRVWLARRNLPAVLRPLYVGSWTGVQLLRWARRPAALRAWFGGWAEGWRADPGERRIMSWRTVGRMARAGRPPII